MARDSIFPSTDFWISSNRVMCGTTRDNKSLHFKSWIMQFVPAVGQGLLNIQGTVTNRLFYASKGAVSWDFDDIIGFMIRTFPGSSARFIIRFLLRTLGFTLRILLGSSAGFITRFYITHSWIYNTHLFRLEWRNLKEVAARVWEYR